MSNTSKENKAIREFYQAVEKLKNKGIIRSDRYNGDIGEYICKITKKKLKLEDNLRNKGYDGTLDGKKVEVKYHNSLKRTNIDLGNPDNYDLIFVVLGPNSCLRNNNGNLTFLIYEFTSKSVEQECKKNKLYSCAKTELKRKKPIKVSNFAKEEDY